MDGFKLNASLQWRLSLWLLLIIVGVALLGGVVSFALTFTEANELQDDMLRQTAAFFDAQHLPAPSAHDKAPAPDQDPEARVQVALLPRANPSGPGNRLRMPPDLADGLQTRTLKGQAYRIFVRRLGPAERIAVAQQTAVRDETAGYSALLALLPFLILVPMLLLVVAGLVRRVFAPVRALADELDERGERDLAPLPAAGLPREIRPFVIAINRLLERVADAMAMQQRFIAAAAHELRSPLTALSLQAERLADADMADSARQRVAVLRQGIERNRMLLDKLLAYARAQSAAPEPKTTVFVHDIFRNILADLMPLAEAREIDIGVDGTGDVRLVTGEFDLTAALKNLIANAIHYSPPGGCIDLSVTRISGAVTIAVEDSGPGIAEAEKARVFEPFYRTLGTDVVGSGLGLSIVKTLVDRLGGDIALTDATRFATGLRATVTVPDTEPPVAAADRAV